MKHKFFVFGLLAILCTAIAFAEPTDKLNFGSQLNATQCKAGDGKLVVNVVQHVVNNADSGVGGNTWALDNFQRQIQVWQTSDTTFCATLKYQGSFVTFAGHSPGNGSEIAAGITGTFEGGYIAQITGKLKSVPGASTRGNIGTVDYACDASGNCPGASFWAELYFESAFTFDQPWWGWIYHAGADGTWVNAVSGNSGDIHN